MIEIASWNVNSIRACLEDFTTWLKTRKPDVLLLQELKGSGFPTALLIASRKPLARLSFIWFTYDPAWYTL